MLSRTRAVSAARQMRDGLSLSRQIVKADSALTKRRDDQPYCEALAGATTDLRPHDD